MSVGGGTTSTTTTSSLGLLSGYDDDDDHYIEDHTASQPNNTAVSKITQKSTNDASQEAPSHPQTSTTATTPRKRCPQGTVTPEDINSMDTLGPAPPSIDTNNSPSHNHPAAPPPANPSPIPQSASTKKPKTAPLPPLSSFFSSSHSDSGSFTEVPSFTAPAYDLTFTSPDKHTLATTGASKSLVPPQLWKKKPNVITHREDE
ncbi:hypothetical protein Pelo_9432 [Pelomyxa schiedti]|nr:hypothetical protein Pelo_9432 [Pelomyxa schiedti]